jgi:tRNA pseudouridine32 synthase/23S rRNA pseudouridine746 synthase
LPIVGDPFWPEMRPDLLADPDPQPPLQLLAQTLTFTDPFTGKTHQFTSKRTLSQWSQDFPMG